MPLRRLLLSATFLVLASVLGLEWVFHSGTASIRQLLDTWHSVHLFWGSVSSVLILAASIYVLDAWRYQAFAAAFEIRLSFVKSVRAGAACFLFSWISPYAVLGPPAGAYLLHEQGSSWEEALLISYGKSISGAVVLLIVSTCLIASGFLPGGIATHGSLFLLGCMAFYLILLCTPPLRARLKTLMRAGFPALVRISLSHLIYFAAWVAICVVWATALGTEFSIREAGVSCLFVALLYMSPTPAGAGVAELAAIPFFGTMMSDDKAVLLVVLFRLSTYGVQIVAGAIYFTMRGGRGLLEAASLDRAISRSKDNGILNQ